MKQQAAFHSLFNGIDQPILVINEIAKHDANVALNKYLGYLKNELNSLQLSDFLHNDNIKIFKDILDGATKTLMQDINIILFHKDNYQLAITANIRLITLNDFKSLLISFDSKTKEKIERIIDSVPCAVFTVDLDKKITSWNQYAESITGYSCKEIIGKDCHTFAIEPCIENCSLYKASTSKPIINRECFIKTKDNKTIPILKNANLLSDNDGNIIGGIESFIDISNIKEAELHLKNSQLHLEKIALNKTKELEHHSQLLQKEIEDKTVVEEELMATNEELNKENEERAAIEEELRTVNEELTLEIQERVKLTNKIKEQYDQYLSVYKKLPEIIYVVDPINYEVIFVNKHYETLLGNNPVGRKCYEAFYGFEKPCDFCTNNIILKNSKKPYEWEHFNSYLNKHYYIKDQIIDWPDGRKVRFEIAIDITDRVNAEANLKKSEATMKVVLNSNIDTIALLEKSGKIVSINESGANRFGKTEHEILGLNIYDLMPSELAIKRKKLIDSVFETGNPIIFEDQRNEWFFINKVYPLFEEDHKTVKQVAIYAIDITDNKLNEIALRESELKFRNFTEFLPIPLCNVDNDTGKIKYLNNKFIEVFGYSIEDIPYLDDWWQKAYPDKNYRKWVMENWTNAVNKSFESGKEIKSDAYNVTCKNGETRTIIIGGVTIVNEFLATFMDITEQKKAEEKIKESEYLYKITTEATKIGIWDWKINTDEVYYSDVWKAQLGYKPDELKNEFSTWSSLLHPDDFERSHEAVNNYLLNPDGPFLLTFRMKHKSGNYRWIHNNARSFIDENGRVNRIFGTHTDITDQRENEERLKINEEKFRNVFEDSPLGKSMTGLDGSLNINAAFSQIIGYNKDELLRKNWKEITHPDDIEESERITQDIIKGKQKTAKYEKRYLHKNGHYVWTEVNTTLHRDEFGNPMFFITTINDISRRKEAEQKMLLEKQISESVIDSSPGIFYQISAEGKFIRWNKNFEKISGYSSEELSQLSPLELFEGEDKDNIAKAIGGVFKDGYQEIEAQFVSKDGTKTPYLFTGILNTIQNVPYLIGVGLNITERIKSEAELLRNYKLNKALINLYEKTELEEKDFIQIALDEAVGLSNSKIGYFHFFDSQTKQIQLVTWSTETLNFCKAVYDNHYPLDKAGIWADAVRLKKPIIINDYKNASNKKGLPEGHFPLHSQLGLPIFEGKKIIGIIGIGNKEEDYTEKDVSTLNIFAKSLWEIIKAKRLEKQVKLSEEKFKSLIKKSPIGIAIYDESENLEFLNDSFINTIGYSLNEIPTIEEWWPLAYPNKNYRDTAKSLWQDTIIKARQNPEGTNPIDAFVHCKNGEIRFFEIVVTPVRDKLLAMFTDLTDRNKAQEDLQKTLENLERSNKELEDFAYIASHDLQEPLRVVGGYVALLARRYKDNLDQDAKEFIQFTEDGVTRMQRMINDILSYSRITTKGKEFTLTNTNDLIKIATNNLKLLIEENNVSIKVDNLPNVVADGNQLVNLFQNLISNSIKYRKEEISPEIKISGYHYGLNIIYKFEDNGIGMKQEYHDKVFKIFHQLHAKTKYQGSGIGLAICKKIVERHNGKIWFESKEGIGSTFYISLPNLTKE